MDVKAHELRRITMGTVAVTVVVFRLFRLYSVCFGCFATTAPAREIRLPCAKEPPALSLTVLELSSAPTVPTVPMAVFRQGAHADQAEHLRGRVEFIGPVGADRNPKRPA